MAHPPRKNGPYAYMHTASQTDDSIMQTEASTEPP